MSFFTPAEQGEANAQLALGAIYARGQGVPQDDDEAVRWFRKAAEQGEAKAQFALGFSYYQGIGVQQDTDEAIHWYRKAAKQGDPQAKKVLSSIDKVAEAFQSLMQMAGARENTKGNMEELRAENYGADVGDNVKRYMEALRTENYETAATQLMYPLNITHAEKEQKLADLVKKIKETNVMLGRISDTDSADMPTGISQNYYVSMIPLKDHPGVFYGITIPVVFTKAGTGVLAFMMGVIDGRQGLYEVQYWCFTCAVKKSK